MLRNKNLFIDTLWNFDIFKGCFENPKISFSDIDAIVEIKGRVLILEFKSPSVSVPRGQQILFESLAKNKNFTILIVWGNPNAPEFLQVYTHQHLAGTSILPCNLQKLKEIIYQWAKGLEVSEIIEKLSL